MTTLLNSFEGGTSGTTITAGNSGGTSGNAFDGASEGTGATNAYDSTQSAHGLLSAKMATASTATTTQLTWSTSMGSQAQVWFRLYLYFTANPAAVQRIWNCTSSGSSCGTVSVTAAGKLEFLAGTAGTNEFTFTTVIPLNQWFRVEGFLTGSATTGQVSLSLYEPLDSASATETHTSAATVNTTGSPNLYAYGVSANLASAGPFWMDDLGLSNTGAIGPVPATSGSGNVSGLVASLASLSP